MKNDAFFVPVLEKHEDKTLGCSLYHVHSLNTASGGIIGVPAFSDVLTECFKNLNMEEPPKNSVSIIRLSDEKLLGNLTDETRSIFLGIFLRIYHRHFHLDYKGGFDSITVTGDLDPRGGRTALKAVGDIPEKYRGLLDYADKNLNQKHLFLYVSEDDKPPDLEKRSNIEIRAFNSKDTLFGLLYFIFGPFPLEIEEKRLDERQKTLIRHISNFQYIRPEGFYAIEEQVLGDRHFKGCFIYGEGDTGKSAFAMALSALLLNRGMIYAPLWIRISDRLYNRRLGGPSQAVSGGDYLEDYGDSEEQYLSSKICAELAVPPDTGLASVLGNRRYAIILDNLEFSPDKIERLLIGLKNMIASRFRLTPYIIITSRLACDEASLEDLGIELRRAPEFGIDSMAAYIDSLTNGREYRDKIERNRQSAEYRSLLEELRANYRWYPGVIKTLVSLLRKAELSDVLVIAKQLGTGEDSIKDKQEEMFYKAFSSLDRDALYLLFTLMSMDTPGNSRERDDIFDELSGRPEYPKNGETRKRLINALGNLLDSNFIYRDQNTSRYGIKTLPYLLFMFNDKFAGFEQEPGIWIRDCLLAPSWRFCMALKYDQPSAVVEELFDKHSEAELVFDNDCFILAAENSSDPDKLDLLLAHGCDINYIYEGELNAFMGAAMFNPNVSIIEWFFKHNVDTSYKYKGWNAFHCAVGFMANPVVLDCMLKHGFKTTDRTEDGLLPLHCAAAQNTNTAILDFFASQKDFDINVRTCVHQGNINIKEILKEVEGNISEEDEDDVAHNIHRILKIVSRMSNKFDHSDFTPIHCAIQNINAEVLRWFFDHHARIEENSNGATLFHISAQFQANPAFLDLFKEYGFDITKKTKDGRTALHCAAAYNDSIPVFEWLKDNGLDINAEDDGGYTPLWHALACNPDLKVLDWFIRNGAVLDFNNDLHIICLALFLRKTENPSVFQWFLDLGININATNSDGNTILYYVAQSECPVENIIWMLEHGADPNICNNKGISALDYLCRRQDWKKIKSYLG